MTTAAVELRSPEWVQLSTAAAITLGLIPGRMHRVDCTHCLNLLLTYPEGCRANCAYCGLARHRSESFAERNFIRVDWPTARYSEIIDRVKNHLDRGKFQRMCLSMITHPDSNHATLSMLDQWVHDVPHIPVSILSNPTTLRREDLIILRDHGAEIFTVALDAASPSVFERTRGRQVAGPHTWEHYWQAIYWAAEIFGADKFGIHLICGLGETERELLEIIQRVHDLGGTSHLFAFFPEIGSLMVDHPSVPHAQWRRMQLARFIIDFAGGTLSNMQFDEFGKLTHFGIDDAQLQALIDSGKPFRTSGCAGHDGQDISACSRPYGDSSPADIFSYPFALDTMDVMTVRRQLAGESWRSLDGETID